MMVEDGGLNIQQLLLSLPKNRQGGISHLAKAIQANIRQEQKAKSLAVALEELVFRLHGKVEHEYALSIKALSAEMAKSSIFESDIVKLSQSKLPDLDIFLSTLKKPKYFEL
jgi:hypothetical protein